MKTMFISENCTCYNFQSNQDPKTLLWIECSIEEFHKLVLPTFSREFFVRKLIYGDITSIVTNNPIKYTFAISQDLSAIDGLYGFIPFSQMWMQGTPMKPIRQKEIENLTEIENISPEIISWDEFWGKI